MTAFSANWKLGIIAKDLSNFLIVVDLKPIFSTIPSIIPSTNIQSPILNLFSTKTKIPEIKFLNKSCAPKATATPNKPSRRLTYIDYRIFGKLKIWNNFY